MCGIIGVWNPFAGKRVADALPLLLPRGRDGFGWSDGKTVELNEDRLSSAFDGVVAHALHAIVGHEPQPLQGKGVLVANCEIYNWRSLAEEEGIAAKNDADLLLQLLDRTSREEKEVISVLDRLDGVFAFIYWRDDQVFAARDPLGVKPMWFSHQDGFFVASEKKLLLAAGCTDVTDLNPRTVLLLDTKTNTLTRWRRKFFPGIGVVERDEYPQLVAEGLREAIRKRIPSRDIKVGVLFSGGLDSTLIAKVLADERIDTTLYTAVVNNPRGKAPHDLLAAKVVAKRYGFTHKVIEVPEADIPDIARTVTEMIEEPNAVKVAVGMPFYVAARQAKVDGCKVLFSGLGAEELFAGYQRHKDASDVNDECIAGLRWLYERDLFRDDVLTMRQGIELRLPFLDQDLVRLSLSIPAGLKLHEGKEKYVLRLAAKELGLVDEDAFRPKKAAQYGSRFDAALKRVARKEGKSRAGYLETLLPVKNRSIGILCSGGKDSWYAAQVMQRLNYELACVLVMKSDNLSSYMFHTPAIGLVSLQAEAAGLPLVEQATKGEKELELEDLKGLLRKAKEVYQIDGVCTGALFSQYQRERIEGLCDQLGLKCFAPLWHLEQESELRELLREQFTITFSAIAGEGLDKSWLGKPVSADDIDRLVALKDRIGFNVAGEGGEYESLVLDCPLFEKRLSLDETEVLSENAITARLLVKSASLQDKA